jgi:hypothetical protein
MVASWMISDGSVVQYEDMRFGPAGPERISGHFL